MNVSEMAEKVPAFLPAKEVLVYLTGLAHILAAVAILINKKAKLATLLLGIMLASFAFLISLGGFMNQDPASSAHFLKDIALAGAAFYLSSHLNN